MNKKNKLIIFILSMALIISIGSICYAIQKGSEGSSEKYLVESIEPVVDVHVDSFVFDFRDVIKENGAVSEKTRIYKRVTLLNSNDFPSGNININIGDLSVELMVYNTEIGIWHEDTKIKKPLYKEGRNYNDYVLGSVQAHGFDDIFFYIEFDKSEPYLYENNASYLINLKIIHGAEGENLYFKVVT